MKNIRVLIVDDHPLFRKGMRSLLESEPDITIIGEATNGLEAVELALTHQPDVVLMDLQMPDGGGLTATRELTDRDPDVRILVVTLFEDDDSIFTALRAGARGYILKDSDEEEIMRAIRAVAGDQAIYSPAIAQRIIHHFDTTTAQGSDEAFPELTQREREILTLIARGESNAAIAEHLTISLKTVRNHVSNIYNKLQVSDRVQAAIRAREAGLK
jgi:DNA-binding NarL/FixJ family response regulator